jgi:DNA polymerase-3 subunit delta
MKLHLGQLKGHLENGLKPVYLLTGDEPLQMMEAADSIRAAAQDQGYIEREVVVVESGFDWRELYQVSGNLSLFAKRRLIDMRLLAGKTPGHQGSAVLKSYAQQPPADTLLLLQMSKLERNALNSAWLRALDQAGVVVQVWPLNNHQSREWIAKRMLLLGMQANDEALSLLAARVEGNLLAARQEIEKLSLLFGERRLDATAVYEAVADSTRYNVFDLADAALAGEARRAVRILYGLQAEDVGTPLVLWSLTEQVRSLVSMSFALIQGSSISEVTQSLWQRRRPLVIKALSRQTYMDWCRLLRRCAQVDRTIKRGAGKDREWQELLQLVLGICAEKLIDEK